MSSEISLRDVVFKISGSYGNLKVKNALIEVDEFDLEFIYKNLTEDFKGKVVSDRQTSIERKPNGQIIITTVKNRMQKCMGIKQEHIIDVSESAYYALKLMINTEGERLGMGKLIED